MKIEFFTGTDGQVWLRQGGKCQTLSASMTQLVDFLEGKIRALYPAAHRRLTELYGGSSRNKTFFRFRIVERFVRCNMGDDNLMSVDIDGQDLHVEQVRCPLRGICEDEHVICSPTPASVFSKAEAQVVTLYAGGLTIREIAAKLRKSVSTVNCQLWRLARRLGLKSRNEVIRVAKVYGLA